MKSRTADNRAAIEQALAEIDQDVIFRAEEALLRMAFSESPAERELAEKTLQMFEGMMANPLLQKETA